MTLLELMLLEKEEICKNKWYLSEKMGHDVGWDRAVVNWAVNYKGRFIKELHDLYKKEQEANNKPPQ